MAKYIILNDKKEVPEGFRNLTDEEAATGFLKLDIDKSYTITKNEWMANCLSLLIKELDYLENIGPDSIMTKIQELSDEFDKYDLDKNKTIDYIEYKNFLMSNIYISE